MPVMIFRGHGLSYTSASEIMLKIAISMSRFALFGSIFTTLSLAMERYRGKFIYLFK